MSFQVMSGNSQGAVRIWRGWWLEEVADREHLAGRCRYAVPKSPPKYFFAEPLDFDDKITKSGGVCSQNP